VEHVFSVEAMVCGYHEYFKAGVKFRMGPLSFACYLSSDVEFRSLPTHALAEEIPENGIFSLNSPFRSGIYRGCLPVVLNLKYQHHQCRSHIHVLHIF